MTPIGVFLLTVLVAVLAKTGAWAMQLRTRNAGMVDAVWAFTLGGLALIYALAGSAPMPLLWLLALMGGLWGARLGLHLWSRNRGKPEDWRYANFREEWGARANFNMFWFFQFQNLFTLALAGLAFMPVAFRPDMPATPLIVLAVVIWLVSVLGEGIADRQLEAFRSDPANRGKVCRRGLWRWSRHPNYFFECLHWLAYVSLAIGAPWGWVSLGAPLIMAFLLTRLSGMPLLEREMMRRKPGYAEYVRVTSPLIPWPPRRG